MTDKDAAIMALRGTARDQLSRGVPIEKVAYDLVRDGGREGLSGADVNAIIAQLRDEQEVGRFYERASWPIGTLVQDPDDPERVGDLVKRCARAWVDRDRHPPMVRWRGKIDAEPIAWERLTRA